MKRNLKSLVWLSVPVLLAVGCAENRRDPSVSYSPALSDSYAPTSNRDTARVYPGTPSNTDVTAPPRGANNQDWQVGQEIRSLLMSNPKLGNAPMAATVNNGVVTLRGTFHSERERQELRDEIARLPGVQRVDDQLTFGNPTSNLGVGEAKNF